MTTVPAPPLPAGPPVSRLRRDSAFAVQAAARDLQARGRDIVHLELGEPDWGPPPAVLEALGAALHDGGGRYTDVVGEPAVRRDVADFYSGLTGARIGPDRVVLVPGSNMVVHFTLLSTTRPGDEVLLPDPGFPSCAELVRLAGAVPVGYPLRAGAGFVPVVEEVADLITPRTRLLILNAPHNPTGTAPPAATVHAIAELAAQHGLYVLFDEAYRAFREDGPGTSSVSGAIADHPRTVIMETLSKSHAMCGWRAGIALVPAAMAGDFTALMTNTNCGMPSPVQRVIPTALAQGEWVAGAAAEMAARRRLAHELLSRVPGVEAGPRGEGFYQFPEVSGTGLSDREFADRLLHEAGVAVVPGSVYGRHGAGHVRIACTQPPDVLTEGLRRLHRFAARPT